VFETEKQLQFVATNPGR